MPRIFTSDELQGLTGDNGERFCVFVRNGKNPLASYWAWFHDKVSAEEFYKGVIRNA